MELKSIVDGILKEKNRSMSWLAEQMGKTFDGLKLSLLKGSIKYNDIIGMAKILGVNPSFFFAESTKAYDLPDKKTPVLAEPEAEYADSKNNLKNCKEMLSALREQLKDKDMIIALLSKKN